MAHNYTGYGVAFQMFIMYMKDLKNYFKKTFDNFHPAISGPCILVIDGDFDAYSCRCIPQMPTRYQGDFSQLDNRYHPFLTVTRLA